MGIMKRKSSKQNERIGDMKMPKAISLSTKLLTIDTSYQRKVDLERVRQIEDEFDPDLFGHLVVSKRNDNLYVVDGGHRFLAVKDFLSEVPCCLWQGLTYEEECAKFRKLNCNRKSLNASVVFNALVCEGDKTALKVVKIMNDFGFTYNRDNQTTKNNMIGSPKRIMQIYEKDGEEELQRLLYINRRAWHGAKEGLTATMLVGLNTFLTENPQAQDNYVIKTLEKIEPNVIKGQASYYVTADNIVGLSGGSSRYVHIANAIKSAYNKTAPKNARIV